MPTTEWSRCTDTDEEEIVELRTRKEVCPTCEGQGKCWPRGLCFTQCDFEEDPDLYEHVQDGTFDRECPECRGLRVVDVVCESDPNYRAWQDHLEEEAAYERMCEAERRFGC